jgi:hypothetical protein
MMLPVLRSRISNLNRWASAESSRTLRNAQHPRRRDRSGTEALRSNGASKGGNLGCAKNPVVQAKNKEFHVKCSLSTNIIVDFNRKTATHCSGYFEGNWNITEGELIYKNKILITIILYAIVLHIIQHLVWIGFRHLTYLHIVIAQI